MGMTDLQFKSFLKRLIRTLEEAETKETREQVLADIEKLKKDLMAAIPGCRHIWDSHIDGTLSVYIGKGVLGAAIQLLD